MSRLVSIPDKSTFFQNLGKGIFWSKKLHSITSQGFLFPKPNTAYVISLSTSSLVSKPDSSIA
jgi:hypothetical protein